MIAGPLPPHPRVVLSSLIRGEQPPPVAAKPPNLSELLPSEAGSAGESVAPPSAADADVLETGLVLLEQNLGLDDDLEVDFFGHDASGAPVLVLCVDGDDEEHVPVRLLDLLRWLDRNVFLLRTCFEEAGCSGVRWALTPRFFLVTANVSARLFERLSGLSCQELEVFDVCSLLFRGQRRYFVRGIAPWTSPTRSVPLPIAPDGLEDPCLRDLLEHVLERLEGLTPDFEVFGDRFSRSVFLNGRLCLKLVARSGELFAAVSGPNPKLRIRSRRDVDSVIDRVLRGLMGMPGKQDETEARRVNGEAGRPRAEREPDPGVTRRPAGRARLGREPVDLTSRLTDDEMEAFLNK